MSANYAKGLSPYENKGRCGAKEYFDSDKKVKRSVDRLTDWICEAKHCVVYCGAGISTAAGIPDFRGPKGIWTMEKNGMQTDSIASNEKSLDEYIPTYTHRALRSLTHYGRVKHIVSQNIDGLFLRLGIDRKYLSEVHGNYFIDQCSKCSMFYVRNRPSPQIGRKPTGDYCPECAGQLIDTIVDWDQELLPDYKEAQAHSSKCDLAICLGTSLQISPFNELPEEVLKRRQSMTRDKKRGQNPPLNKLVIINLQKTKIDSKADLVIHQYCDQVMQLLMENLGIEPLEYSPFSDPVKVAPDFEHWVPHIRLTINPKRYDFGGSDDQMDEYDDDDEDESESDDQMDEDDEDQSEESDDRMVQDDEGESNEDSG